MSSSLGKYQAAPWLEGGPARLLLVFDRPLLAAVVELVLEHGAFTSRVIGLASQIEPALAEWQPHLVILDMDLVRAQRNALSSHTGAASARPPFLGLARRGDLKAKLDALEAGVDDFISIPFAPDELLARVITVLQRSYGVAVSFTPAIRIGELEADIVERTVRLGTSKVTLTALEQSLLYLLAANAGRVVSREEILDALWGADYVAEGDVVNREVHKLRARLQDNDWRNPRFIATVRDRGYRFLW